MKFINQKRHIDLDLEMVRNLIDVPHPEAKKWIEESRIFFLPIGSVEQEGPGGPLGMNGWSALNYATRLAEKLEGVLLPLIPVGCAPYHLKWAGSLSVPSDILMGYIKGILESIAKHGVKKIVIVHGHEGNLIAAQQATAAIQAEYQETDICILCPWMVVYGEMGKEWEGHFGKWEICQTLVHKPETLDFSKLVNPSDFEQAYKAHYRVRRKDAAWYFKDFTEVAPTGWYAHPSAWKVTRQECTDMLDKSTDRLIEIMKEMGFIE